MKLRNLLLCGVCALFSTFAVAEDTFPITLTTADGLPEQTSDAAKAFNGWTSRTFNFAEPVSSFRMTVTHCSWQDALSTSNNGSRGYVFFTMGEFYLYDANGQKVELTVDNFSSNAAEAASTADGAGLAGLCDGDESTYFHTTYSTPEADCPNPIGAEYYLEVTLPEPMKSFKIGFQKRSNNANIPSEFILTAGGVEANPFPDYEFQLGEKVDADDIQMGAMYVLCDEGNVSAYEGTYLYPATNGVPGYNCIDGKNGYHLRRTPNVDCIFVPLPAGVDEEGKSYFYLRNYLTGSYVRNAVNWHEPTNNLAEAAKLHFVEVDGVKYLMSNTNINFATNSQASFVAYQDKFNRPMYLYKASIAAKYIYQDLQAVIADVEGQLAANKAKFADSDQGETAACEAALKAAKAVTATSSLDEINAAKLELESAAASFLSLQLYIWIDEIAELLETVTFGNDFGNYPIAQKTALEELLNKISTDVDGREFTALEDIESYIASCKKVLDEFYGSKIESYSEWPLHLYGENGAVVFEPYDAHPSCYIYKSPTFYLEEEVERIYITTVQTNTGDKGGGWPCTNWAHFTLYDGTGEIIYLTPDNFSTNALEEGDGQGIPGICDVDEDGNPDLTTYMHTLYSTSKPETNEHYICVEFPEPMNVFRFDLISRENGRLVPTEMVIGSEPYHYVADASVTLLDMVTKASQIDPNKYYILKGNINVVSEGSEGSGFYSSYSSAVQNPQREGVVQFVPSDVVENAYKVLFVVDNYYLTEPANWEGASTTVDSNLAGSFFITESENLKDAFKIWTQGADTKYVLQDWSGSMGYFTAAGEGFENDDKDGESDWTIYEVVAPIVPVFVTQVKKAANLNTDGKFAMAGNLGALNPDYGNAGGFYSGIQAVGADATNYTLFNLEDGGNGTYKIHFIVDDVYLKAPTGWDSMHTTTDPAEAGCFVFAESQNIAGAFNVYAKGSYEKDGSDFPYAILQDWGESMGSFPIKADFSDNDTDGESDWTIYTASDPSEIALFRDDYLGTYIYKWDNYWDNHDTKTFDTPEVELIADPDSEDGVILTHFGNYGNLKGVFDGQSHNIIFPTYQLVDQTDQWDVYYMTLDGNDISFYIDLLTGTIIYRGRAGVQNVSNTGGDNGGWHFLSNSWVELEPVAIGAGIKPVVVSEDAEVVGVSIYTVNGQAVEAPVQGINIIRTIMSDGSVKVQKVLVK